MQKHNQLAKKKIRIQWQKQAFKLRLLLGLLNDKQIVVHSAVNMHVLYTTVHVIVLRGQLHIHYAAGITVMWVLSHQLVASLADSHKNCFLMLSKEGKILRIIFSRGIHEVN